MHDSTVHDAPVHDATVHDSPMTALVLGTAQWGASYGVTNAIGRLTDAEISEIVAVARDAGLSDVDTARGYGDAENRLRPFAREFSITTKVAGGEAVADQVLDSCAVLGVEALAGVLIHDWDSLNCTGHDMSVLALGQLVDAGSVSRVGVSVYDAAALESAVETFAAAGVPLGVVQVPANVLDRRLDSSSLLMELAVEGAQIVVRSAFLQGVLLVSGGGLADHPEVARFREEARARGQSLLEATLGHVKALPWATHVVVGVTSAAELREIAVAWEACEPVVAPAEWGCADRDLIDPRRW